MKGPAVVGAYRAKSWLDDLLSLQQENNIQESVNSRDIDMLVSTLGRKRSKNMPAIVGGSESRRIGVALHSIIG